MPGRHVCPAVRVAIKVCLMSGRRRGAGKLTLSRQLDRDFIRQAVHMNTIPLYPRAEPRHKAIYRRIQATGTPTDTPTNQINPTTRGGQTARRENIITGFRFCAMEWSIFLLTGCLSLDM